MDNDDKKPEEIANSTPDAKAAPVPVEQLDPRTRAQVARDLHRQKQKERQDKADELKHIYLTERDSPAIADILAKARSFAAYHTKLAKDGVGAKNVGLDDSGAPIIEDVILTSEQRMSELDQAKGIEQLISYVEQKLAQ